MCLLLPACAHRGEGGAGDNGGTVTYLMTMMIRTTLVIMMATITTTGTTTMGMMQVIISHDPAGDADVVVMVVTGVWTGYQTDKALRYTGVHNVSSPVGIAVVLVVAPTPAMVPALTDTM